MTLLGTRYKSRTSGGGFETKQDKEFIDVKKLTNYIRKNKE